MPLMERNDCPTWKDSLIDKVPSKHRQVALTAADDVYAQPLLSIITAKTKCARDCSSSCTHDEEQHNCGLSAAYFSEAELERCSSAPPCFYVKRDGFFWNSTWLTFTDDIQGTCELHSEGDDATIVVQADSGSRTSATTVVWSDSRQPTGCRLGVRA